MNSSFESFLPADILDPRFHKTYSDTVTVTESTINSVRRRKKPTPTRAKKPYSRPSDGWLKLGLDVSKYADRTWLGGATHHAAETPRNTSDPREWMVGYHGCSYSSVERIVRRGFRAEVVWVSQYLNGTEHYSRRGLFRDASDGKVYCVVLMCRVNPKKAVDQGTGTFACTPENIRPYAVLIKETEDAPANLSNTAAKMLD